MKKITLIALLLLMMVMVTSCNKKERSKKLQMSGTYYDNIEYFENSESDENKNNKESISGMAKIYLQSVTYEIKELDESNKTAIVDVNVPNTAKLLPQIISDVIDKNDAVSYEELLQAVQNELEAMLLDENTERLTTTIELPFEEDEDYKLIINEDWEQAVYGNLENMYIDCYRTLVGGLTDEISE